MEQTVKQLKSGKYAVVEGGKNILVTNNYGDIPDKKRAILAAAAPALLEACKYVVRYHREHDSGEGELFGLDFVTTCIDAIRKAEGR